MMNSRKTAYQAEEIDRLRKEKKELASELRAAGIELASRDKTIAQVMRENELLRENFERFLQGYAERIEALEEAERGFNEMMSETKDLQKKLRREAEAQIEEMRRANKNGN